MKSNKMQHLLQLGHLVKTLLLSITRGYNYLSLSKEVASQARDLGSQARFRNQMDSAFSPGLYFLPEILSNFIFELVFCK